jgi:hypothetical protein
MPHTQSCTIPCCEPLSSCEVVGRAFVEGDERAVQMMVTREAWCRRARRSQTSGFEAQPGGTDLDRPLISTDFREKSLVFKPDSLPGDAGIFC